MENIMLLDMIGGPIHGPSSASVEGSSSGSVQDTSSGGFVQGFDGLGVSTVIPIVAVLVCIIAIITKKTIDLIKSNNSGSNK